MQWLLHNGRAHDLYPRSIGFKTLGTFLFISLEEVGHFLFSLKLCVVNYSQGVVNDATLPAPLTG